MCIQGPIGINYAFPISEFGMEVSRISVKCISPAPTRPWDQVSMDFLSNLPSSALHEQKFNSLSPVEDNLSKQCHLIPTTTNVKAEGVAKLYFDHVHRLHGM